MDPTVRTVIERSKHVNFLDLFKKRGTWLRHLANIYIKYKRQ